ncbi:DUF1439 domain-containing protein [Ramlibacter pallidus]|uniref:DUF1439 domain-containing protein n=1 Tax=Ramlibacter pallidus TaxID=2780087 RepID=A0ABR9S5W7_9BURK|nr:DUF1439 domain-containing protein [Ramlibacter pallidus]MBE7368918.1 DUF1439 domain-containing protein [Ramlibacter pallidus]
MAARAAPTLPRRKIPASQLLEALSARFPLRFALPGWVELEVGAPALLLLARRNKLGAVLQLEAKAPTLRDPAAGEVDVLFALRYEPTDRTVRAHQPEAHRVHVPGLGQDATYAIENATRALLSRMRGDVVLHRFTDRELALPDVMGFEPGNLIVLEDGLDIEFVPKQRP